MNARQTAKHEAEMLAKYEYLVRAYTKRMVKRHRRLAAWAADFAQEGRLGLLYAIRTFDPDRGCAFTTYAVHNIWGYIRNTLSFVSVVRTPPRVPFAAMAEIDAGVLQIAAGETGEACGLELRDSEALRARLFKHLVHSASERTPHPERDADLFVARLSGSTLDDAGKRIGLTRARVCQLVAKQEQAFEKFCRVVQQEAA